MLHYPKNKNHFHISTNVFRDSCSNTCVMTSPSMLSVPVKRMSAANKRLTQLPSSTQQAIGSSVPDSLRLGKHITLNLNLLLNRSYHWQHFYIQMGQRLNGQRMQQLIIKGNLCMHATVHYSSHPHLFLFSMTSFIYCLILIPPSIRFLRSRILFAYCYDHKPQ